MNRVSMMTSSCSAFRCPRLQRNSALNYPGNCHNTVDSNTNWIKYRKCKYWIIRSMHEESNTSQISEIDRPPRVKDETHSSLRVCCSDTSCPGFPCFTWRALLETLVNCVRPSFSRRNFHRWFLLLCLKLMQPANYQSQGQSSPVFNSTHFALLNRSTVGTCKCLNVFVDIPYVPYTPARNLLKGSNLKIIGRYQIQMCINSFAMFLTCGTNTIMLT